MKRWQARGEVEDSEDDELSLDESPSPQRPRKRQKHSQAASPVFEDNAATRENGAQNFSSEAADAEAWLRPKTVKTYGRKPRPSKLTAPDLTSISRMAQTELQENNQSHSLSIEAFQTSDVGPNDEPITTPHRLPLPPTTVEASTPQDVIGTTPEGQPAGANDEKNSCPSAQTARAVPRALRLAKLEGEPASDSDELSNLETDSDQPANEASVPMISALSSPLSSPSTEREKSPFVEIRKIQCEVTAVPRTPSENTENAKPDDVPVDTASDPGQSFSPAHFRRNLRNRKPEQLNPYQVERLRYLQQCRARGVKPVKLIEREASNQGSESASQGSDDQQHIGESGVGGFEVHASSSQESQARVHGTSHVRQQTSTDLSNNNLQDLDRPTKRVKLTRRKSDFHSERAHQAVDEFGVPPSPPRTSSSSGTSDEAALPDARRTASGFIMPLGLTPAPLPTPQISSEAGLRGASPESGLGTSREGQFLTIPSSSEDESEVEYAQLRREQKRIRGVLPASWLKLDFRARTQQRPSSSTRHTSFAASPSPEPQKGVARQVQRRNRRSNNAFDLPMWSHDSSDTDGTPQTLTPLRKHDSPRPLPDSLGLRTDEALDIDLMENDFVDPMLAGGSYRRRLSKKDKGRQPRITEAFRGSVTENNFSEERVQSGRNISKGVPRPRITQPGSGPRRQKRSYVRLSIADYISSPAHNEPGLPSFMKLALRRARQREDKGRHSPTGKIVRLPTADETKEASSMLHAWRKGSIAPRSHGSAQEQSAEDGRHDSRLSPAEMLSSPVQREQNHSSVKLSTHTHRKRQTRLEPVVQRREASQPSKSGEIDARHGKHRRRARPLSDTPRLRGAQLETLEREFDDSHRAAMFERRMQCLTESVALPVKRGQASAIQMDRFLHNTGREARDTDHQHSNDERDPGGNATVSQAPRRLTHRPRKAISKRLETEHQQYRQPDSLSLELEHDEIQEREETELMLGPVLQGLGQFGATYSHDFNVQPLGVVFPFHDGTFIGSKDFEQALRLGERNLDRPAGHIRMHVNQVTFEWGAWTDEVATQFSRIPQAIEQAFRSLAGTQEYTKEQHQSLDRNVDYFLRSLVRYCSSCMYFLDAIDRQSCIQTLERTIVKLSDVLTEIPAEADVLRNTVTRVRQYQLVLAKQAEQLSAHVTVPDACRTSIDELIVRLGQVLAKDGVLARLEELCAAYGNMGRSSARDAGLEEDMWALSSIVILNHVFRETTDPKSQFWQIMNLTSGIDIAQTCEISEMERIWRSLFLILPALEIDATGTARAGSRLCGTQEAWNVAGALVNRSLELYEPSSRVRGFTVNGYVRTLIARVHCLVNQWGWWRCGHMLNNIYDFFAQRNLGLLRNEDGHGSPKFLEELNGNPSFEVLPDDRSFHIFLKLLASGLLGMKKYNVYRDSKITGIAWRLLPNHSRSYRKDVELQRVELDALRNHYDLLCTLYYAMAPGHRLSTDIMRNLVDQATSHREACRVSVRAWANIASFQMSTGEAVDALKPLSAWFADILRINMAQFRLAKTEAERGKQQAEMAGVHVEHAVLERTIARNQTEIAKILVDALAGLKRALSSASSLQLATALLNDTQFWLVFELFDPSQCRLHSAMLEALQLADTVLTVDERLKPSAAAEESSGESQDFGDSSALQELVAIEDTETSTPSRICEVLLLPVSHLLSNVFGADSPAGDDLLGRLVDVWVRLAAVTVSQLQTPWSSYVDDYSRMSWHQMRDTSHRRKYTTYFMAKVIERSGSQREVVDRAMTVWLLSLVEREAVLKFQHILTSTLLNHCRSEALLYNLPFAIDRKTGKFDISLHEVRQRRVALISAVLCNMRAEYDDSLSLRLGRKEEVQGTYRSILRQLMNAMKTQYQDLQGNREVAEAGVQGAYVEFVQQSVSLLQQHTSGICQIDRFFTDSTAFPLPATDPTYVVGRLRSYIPRLRESRTRTQLAFFIHTVSERAATDNQQHYLTQQLVTAMTNVNEVGNKESPTLRHVLMTSVVPAYIENALDLPCGWTLALPMLEACEKVIQDLLYDIHCEVEDSALAATEIVGCVLDSIFKHCGSALRVPGQLLLPHVLKVLCNSVKVAKSSIVLISSIARRTLHGSGLDSLLVALDARFAAFRSCLEWTSDSLNLDVHEDLSALPQCAWPDTRLQAERQVRDAMTTSWSASNGRYWVKRGNVSKEVVVEEQNLDEERIRLLQAITEFCEAFTASSNPRLRKLQVSREDEALQSMIV